MPDQSIQSPRVVILTALSVEYQAVRSHISNLHEEIYKGTVYECDTFPTSEQQWEVSIV